MSGIKKPTPSPVIPAKDDTKHETVIANAPSRGPAAPRPAMAPTAPQPSPVPAAASRAIDEAVQAAQGAAAAAQAKAKEGAETVSRAAQDALRQSQAMGAEAVKGLTQAAAPMGEAVRQLAEKGMEQAKGGYEQARKAAEGATGAMEESFAASSRGMTELNQKALDAARANVNSAFELAQKMSGARTMAEVLELQTAYARQQFETVQGQARDIAEAARKAMTQASEPLKAAAQAATPKA